MLELAQGCQAVLPGLPSLPCSPISLEREYDSEASSSPPKAPALVSTPCSWLQAAAGRLRVASSHAQRLTRGLQRAGMCGPKPGGQG